MLPSVLFGHVPYSEPSRKKFESIRGASIFVLRKTRSIHGDFLSDPFYFRIPKNLRGVYFLFSLSFLFEPSSQKKYRILKARIMDVLLIVSDRFSSPSTEENLSKIGIRNFRKNPRRLYPFSVPKPLRVCKKKAIPKTAPKIRKTRIN